MSTKQSVLRHVINNPVSVAPMMDWTDRHCRYFLRLISPHILLYTEMLTTGALLYGDSERFLAFSECEHPVALQLGGSNPDDLSRCANKVELAGYDEVNLNVGCPSDRVQSGKFGACLMAEPELVADCVRAMRETVNIPVTVKTRIGIDELDDYAVLVQFVERQIDAGVSGLIVHARKAWLKGLSPKENRDVPPLDYPRVYQLKQDFPELFIAINGGVVQVDQLQQHLQHVDSVMVGRVAYQNPYILADIEQRCFLADSVRTRHEVIEGFLPYVESQLNQGIKLQQLTRHILGLFNGQQGARAWRRVLSEQAHRAGAGVEVLERALAQVGTDLA